MVKIGDGLNLRNRKLNTVRKPLKNATIIPMKEILDKNRRVINTNNLIKIEFPMTMKYLENIVDRVLDKNWNGLENNYVLYIESD